MNSFPHRKTFLQDLQNTDGTKICTIEYKQATIKEFDEFTNQTNELQTLEIIRLVQKAIPKNIFEKMIKKLYPRYTTHLERRVFSLNTFRSICEKFLENSFRKHVSKFEKQKKGNRKSLYSANMANVCSKYHISGPLELVENYTLEQYMWMVDGIIFLNNEHTKEGRAMNNFASRDVKKAEKDAKQIREAFENAEKLKANK